jgi:hypothetical protein
MTDRSSKNVMVKAALILFIFGFAGALTGSGLPEVES